MKKAWKLVDDVKLKNTYRVESSATEFRVSSNTERGADFGQLVSGEIVDYLRDALRGQTVRVEEAIAELEQSSLQLPYQYGHKLRYFTQNVLVVLVATDVASVTKVGRRFEYYIG